MNANDIIRKKGKEKIVMLTAYDYQMAKILDATNIDIILVGDSLGMVFQGFESTRHVTLHDMMYHTSSVRRGTKRKMVVSDLPIGTYDTPDEAIKSSTMLVDSGADAVKLEGNFPQIIEAIVEHGIPVMGHVGLLPQSASKYRVVGMKPEEHSRIVSDSLSISQAGAFSIVVESVPVPLGKEITESVNVPTIGIGAGRYCDGQVLVINDLLTCDPSFKPKFVKRYANLGNLISEAVAAFSADVRANRFPDEEHSYGASS